MTTRREDEQVMTVAYCDRLHGDLQHTLQQHFAAVHGRIDDIVKQMRETNGRLRDVEVDVAVLQRPPSGEPSSITRRDVQMVCVTLGTVGTVLAMLRWLWPLLHRAFMGP